MMRAAVAFLVVLLLGAAFLNQGERQRDAERRLAAVGTADRVAAALGRDLRQAIDAARLEAGDEAVRSGLDPEELAVPTPGDAHILGPMRAANGVMKLVARVALRGGDERPAYATAVMDLDALLLAAGIPGLAREGFEHRLTAAGARAPTVSRSGDAGLESPVVRHIAAGSGQWSLELAPVGGWRQESTLALHALLVLILGFAAALVVHDRGKEGGMLRAAVAQREARLRDVTRQLLDESRQREELEKQFSHASFHDALTGLPNRRFLVNRLENALKRGLTGGGALPAVAIVELGRLKPISDSLGLAVADELLRQAAQRVEGTVGGGQVVCRSGDSAYATVLSGTRQEALEKVYLVQQALSQAFTISGHTLFIVAFAGVAFAESGYDHPEDLLRAANIALTRAKREQARVAVFDPKTREQVIGRQQLETDLHGVAERGELRLHYQPIIALDTGRIAGFEALVRWRHPVEGMISPGLFIPLAEETGLIEPITRWVMREASRQAGAWNAHLPAHRHVYVSVNLSAHDMRVADMGDFVERVIGESAIAATMLRLEVTEGSMIDNLRAAKELIARFRAMGVKVLLDDFGTGYSSLSYLNQFQIDFLKIDQSFVRQITPDPRSSGIVRAILSMCEGMDIRTVAEGIETAEAVQLLRGLNCDYGQGYFFSKPVEADAATQLLEKGVPQVPHRPDLRIAAAE